MAFVSSPSSTNEVNTANVQFSTANSPVSTVDSLDSTANLNDLEEMDLKWQLALLSMRARMYFQITECRGPKNQDNRNKNQDSSRRIVNVEETSSKSMVAIDEAGFDWSFMADEEVPTNMALIAILDSEKNEVMFGDQLVVLKRDTSFKDSEINALKRSQISDNSRKGVGFVSYNVVPPPPTGLYAPPTIDLSNSGLEEFQQHEFERYKPKASKSVYKDTSNEVKKTPDAPLARKPVRLTAITIKGKRWLMLLRPQHVGFGDLPNLIVHQLLSRDKVILMHEVHPQKEDQGYVDSGCSRHMTGNMSYLSDFKEFDGGYVTFGGGARGGRITGKGTLKTDVRRASTPMDTSNPLLKDSDSDDVDVHLYRSMIGS
ncbi:hypothetical protein Tco_0466502 [Tanacetum coccineum]